MLLANPARRFSRLGGTRTTSAYNYNLTYLRRGGYGTTIASHSSGANFVRMDDGVFAYPYSKSQIGLTIYIKLVSFNVFGGGLQSISSVSPTTYTIQGTPLLATVQNFAVQQQGSNVVFSWTDLQDFDSLKGYDLLYGPQGGSPSNATMITEASRATEMTTASIPPGTWTFYICGHDIADQTGPYSTANLTVVNVNDVIDQQFNEPGWLGTLSGFLLHYTGVLVPDSTKQANAMTNAQLFEQFVPFPVSNPTYTTPVLDTGFNSTFRAWANIAASTGRGVSGSPSITFSLDYWANPASDPGIFYPWTIGQVTGEYVVGRITMNTAIPSYVSAFDLFTDTSAGSQTSNNFAVGSSGSTWTYPTQFHTAPNVQVTPTSAGATSGSATSVTATSAFIQLWNGTTEVSGTANLSASGV